MTLVCYVCPCYACYVRYFVMCECTYMCAHYVIYLCMYFCVRYVCYACMCACILRSAMLYSACALCAYVMYVARVGDVGMYVIV